MAAGYEVGDDVAVVFEVPAGDPSTTATATLYPPVGASSTPAPAPAGPAGSEHTRWSVTFTAATAGEYRVRLVVAGPGAGAETREVPVAPSPAGPLDVGIVYATTEDLAKYLQAAPPPGSARRLARASRRIDRALLTAIYDVDVDGYPTDVKIRAAVRDATCAQAEYMKTTGDDGTGYVARYPKVQIGSLSIDRGSAANAPAAQIAPTALDILAQAGIALGEVGYY